MPIMQQQVAQNLQLIKITAQSGPANNAAGQFNFVFPQGVYDIDKSYVELKWVTATTTNVGNTINVVSAIKNVDMHAAQLITQKDGVQISNIANLAAAQLGNQLDKMYSHQGQTQSYWVAAGGAGSNAVISSLPIERQVQVATNTAATFYQKIPLRDYLVYHFLDSQQKFRIFNQMLLQLTVVVPTGNFFLQYAQSIAAGVATGSTNINLILAGVSCDINFYLCLDPNDQQHMDQLQSFYIEQKQASQSPIFNFSVGVGQTLIKQTYSIHSQNFGGGGNASQVSNINDIQYIGILETAQDAYLYGLKLQRNGYNLVQSDANSIDTAKQLANFNKSQFNGNLGFCIFHDIFENSQIQTISTSTNGSTNDTHIMGYNYIQRVA